MKKQPIVTLEGLTREQQKIVIAQDVIENIKAQKYIAETGSYIDDVEDARGNNMKYNNRWKDEDVKAQWEQLGTCNVCGIGACLMSITKFKNNLTFGDLPSSLSQFEKVHIDLLSSIFTGVELAAIEAMFEGYYSNDKLGTSSGNNIGRDEMGAVLSEDLIEYCLNFGDNYGNEERTLLAIMQYIVDHNGEVYPKELHTESSN